MKNVVILGSTGSLGTQTIEVLKRYKDEFKIVGLCANTSKELLNIQAGNLNLPREKALLSSENPKATTLLAQLFETDIVVNVLSGTAGIEPTKTALKAGKTLLLGNKESLVAAGEEVMKLASNHHPAPTSGHSASTPGLPTSSHSSTGIIPLDSEHNAIFEILKAHPQKTVKRLIIPCSGGPFFDKSEKDLVHLTVADALKHPKWNMGPKITLESALLINKGLEIIEAYYLFNIPLSKITAKIHPECQIHGIVEFETPTNEQPLPPQAYISTPDMREHIENAFLHVLGKKIDQTRIQALPDTFKLHNPDHKTFPGIKITLEAFQKDPSPSNMQNFLKKEEEIINHAWKKKEYSFLKLRHAVSRIG